MKKILPFAMSLLAIMMLSGFLQKKEPPEFLENELLIKYKSSLRAAEVDSALTNLKAEKIKNLGKINVFRIRLPKDLKLENTLAALRSDPNIEFVEPNYVYQLNFMPNDRFFNKQWNMHNTGQTGGTSDADIDAPEAWDVATGDPRVIVAVIDTGVDYKHEDLRDNMWINTNEIAGDGVDNDNNGYKDDIFGYDFIDDDSDPMDYHNHGTHVAGTIGAVGNNNIGVAGVNLKTKIMALKIFKPLECGGVPVGNITNAADSAEAIIYAAANQAKVINASWGGRRESLVIKSAIEAANLAGVLFVAAAGNDGTDNDTTPHYPSSHSTSLPNVIAVAATDHNDNLASFSNIGKMSVQLGAPGVDILSSVRDNDYKNFSGTSMAAPHVAGAAALVWAKHPSLNHLQVKECILRNVDPKPALTNKVSTGGRLNLYNAVRCNPLAQNPAEKAVWASMQPPDLPLKLRNAAQLELLGRYARAKIGLYYVLLLMPVGFILGWKIRVRKK